MGIIRKKAINAGNIINISSKCPNTGNMSGTKSIGDRKYINTAGMISFGKIDIRLSRINFHMRRIKFQASRGMRVKVIIKYKIFNKVDMSSFQ